MTALGNKDIFAKNLRYYVERSGRDRKEIAEALGIPYSTFTEWCNARKYPRIDRIEKLADYFGVMKSDLIEEKPVDDDGLDSNLSALIEFAKRVPEDKAAMVLRVMKSILEDG